MHRFVGCPRAQGTTMCERRRPHARAPSARRARARVSLGLAVGVADVRRIGVRHIVWEAGRCRLIVCASMRGRDVVGHEVAERLLVALEADVGDTEGDGVAVLLSEPRRQLVLVHEGG
eukprot:3753969-Prymnesium_polylepis.1